MTEKMPEKSLHPEIASEIINRRIQERLAELERMNPKEKREMMLEFEGVNSSHENYWDILKDIDKILQLAPDKEKAQKAILEKWKPLALSSGEEFNSRLEAFKNRWGGMFFILESLQAAERGLKKAEEMKKLSKKEAVKIIEEEIAREKRLEEIQDWLGL
jgi:hypothetical protein